MKTTFQRDKYPNELSKIAQHYQKDLSKVTDKDIALYNLLFHETRYGIPLHGIPCITSPLNITVISDHGFEDTRS